MNDIDGINLSNSEMAVLIIELLAGLVDKLAKDHGVDLAGQAAIVHIVEPETKSRERHIIKIDELIESILSDCEVSDGHLDS